MDLPSLNPYGTSEVPNLSRPVQTLLCDRVSLVLIFMEVGTFNSICLESCLDLV
jgi:hypothetical protein